MYALKTNRHVFSLLHFELLEFYQLTRRVALAPFFRSATSSEPERIGHAGVAPQYDWNTGEATPFQHVLISV